MSFRQLLEQCLDTRERPNAPLTEPVVILSQRNAERLERALRTAVDTEPLPTALLTLDFLIALADVYEVRMDKYSCRETRKTRKRLLEMYYMAFDRLDERRRESAESAADVTSRRMSDFQKRYAPAAGTHFAQQKALWSEEN